MEPEVTGVGGQHEEERLVGAEGPRHASTHGEGGGDAGPDADSNVLSADDGEERDQDEYVPEDLTVKDDEDLSSSAGEDDSNSDEEYNGGSRQRKAKAPPARPPRPETAMVKKLRSAGPSVQQLEDEQMATAVRASQAGCGGSGKAKAGSSLAASNGAMVQRSAAREGSAGPSDGGGGSVDGSGGDGAASGGGGDGGEGQEDVGEEEGEEEEEEEPTRTVDEETAAKDLAQVHAMWEFSAIIEFLFRFRAYLQLECVFTVDTLAEALVHEAGPGLLQQLHTELLAGILSSPKALKDVPHTCTTHTKVLAMF
ncbi:hypothetical protein FOA52_009894 [Chlamydomonas sp. UWO 241]|nr:hypothetical protein FOA52_009894 [Chlamydomonas sp. UWO 241]